MRQPKVKRVLYRTVRPIIERDQETGEKIKVYTPDETLPSSYIHYDEHGNAAQKIYSLRQAPDPKTGKMFPVAEDIRLLNGHLELIMPQGKTLVDFIESAPYLDTPKNRKEGRRILIERVDIAKEKEVDITNTMDIVTAFNLIEKTDLMDLLEYARSLRIDTYDMDELLALPGKKNFDQLRRTEEMKLILVDLMRVAKADPTSFIKGLADPLRAMLALIADGIETNTITFDSVASQYCWVMGNDRSPIINVPKGVARENWFAQWLNENKPTMTELRGRVDLSRRAVDKS